MSEIRECCSCPTEKISVPITGITVPFSGFGVEIDASSINTGLSADQVQSMINEAVKKAIEESQNHIASVIEGMQTKLDGSIEEIQSKLNDSTEDIQIKFEDSIADVIKQSNPYQLCEFYYFRNPVLRPGFKHAEGDLIHDANILYPEAWAYLQTGEGQALCKTEAEWQAMNTAVWHTNADGTKVGWNGVGGVPYYVIDTAKRTLRLPDLRGMYVEAAGFDSLGVGGVHGDGIRAITGTLCTFGANITGTGVFKSGAVYTSVPYGSPSGSSTEVSLDISQQMPLASQNQPKAWGALACVYLGQFK